jgi:hypothetical protein
MKAMRLRRVSHLVVSSVLASCGGEEAHRVVTIPPAPSTSSSIATVELPPADVMDVVPTDVNARMRFVTLAEIVGALAPPDPNRVALYAVDASAVGGLQRVRGPSPEDACNAALSGTCGNFGTARFLSIAKDGTITRGTFDDLDPARTHDAMIARAFGEMSKVKGSGMWFIDGVPGPFPAARALTEETKVAPSEDALPAMARVSPNVARLGTLHGDARERDILALRLPAMDRAVLRAVLAVGDKSILTRVTPLARGWMLETVNLFEGGCGSSVGMARVVVLGSNVIVDVRANAYPRPCKGRRPPNWNFTPSGRFFEDAACAEAASVEAFELIARELESFGAPRDLVLRARAAARDESRHADAMSRRAGFEPARARGLLSSNRTPFEAALDNAVEGCVNESFAAIVARFQSRMARDQDVAREFAAIADDECSHGDLARDIASWLEPRLGSSERARIDAAREGAKRDLVAGAFEASGSIDDATARETLGLPTRAQATALATAFVETM